MNDQLLDFVVLLALAVLFVRLAKSAGRKAGVPAAVTTLTLGLAAR